MQDDNERALARGEALGPYTVQRVLGAGAFGVVYEALKAPLNKRVALKVLRRAFAGDVDINARFLREAQAAASLKHPHIVEVDDAGAVDGVPFLAMEYLEGRSLADRIDHGGRMPVGVALDLMLPVCSAVAAVHARGIIHRDLKPDNIFLWEPVAGQPHPKLLDFGIAKLHDNALQGSLTQTGTMFGTPKYMPPEQWAGSKNTTAQSDQWALAVIVYECLTAATPYDAEEIPTLVLKMATEPPRPLRSLAPEAPEALSRALERALARDPSQRFPSVREFARALLPFASVAAQSRWGAEFEPREAVERASTLNLVRFDEGPRPDGAAAQSRTIERSAMEVPARPPPAPLSRGRVALLAALAAVVALAALGLSAVDRSRAPAMAASVAPTTIPAAAVERPAPQRVTPPPPAPPPAPPAVAAIAAAPEPAPVPTIADPPSEPAAPREHRHGRRHRRRDASPAAAAGEMPNL